jgi:hypothetical protein
MAERPTKRPRLEEESFPASENKDEEMEEPYSAVLDPDTRPSDLYLDTVRFHSVD